MSGSRCSEKGASLSDKSAQKEYGLTMADIIDAIRKDKLQYIEQSVYGNPFFRLLRHEVEALVVEKFGEGHLTEKKIRKELAQVKKELRGLKTRVGELEQRRTELLQSLGACS